MKIEVYNDHKCFSNNKHQILIVKIHEWTLPGSGDTELRFFYDNLKQAWRILDTIYTTNKSLLLISKHNGKDHQNNVALCKLDIDQKVYHHVDSSFPHLIWNLILLSIFFHGRCPSINNFFREHHVCLPISIVWPIQ